MLQLAKDVGVVDESMQSFGDMTFEQVIESIHKLQENLGITGNTEKEAATTIEGTINMTKAAWENLLTAMANPKEDLSKPIQDLITAIVGENEGEGLINQILPAVEATLTGIGTLIEELVPVLLDRLPQLLDENLPKLIYSALSILESIVNALTNNADDIGKFVTELVQKLVEWVTENLPKIVQMALTIIITLVEGLTKALPELIPALVQCIRLIVDTLTNPKQLAELINAALELVITLVEGLMDNLDELIDAAIQIILNLVDYLLKPNNLEKIVGAALRIVIALAGGLIKAIPQLVMSVAKLIMQIGDTITHNDWGSFGKNIVDGLVNGLANAWHSITSWWSNAWNGLVDSAKSWLGIASPSKVFKKIGAFTAEGFGEGWKDEISDVKDNMEDDLNFDTNISTGIGAVGNSVMGVNPITVTLTIENFYNNTDKDIETLADTLMGIMNDKTVRQGAAYA